MKRGTAAKVILGKDTLMDVPAGIVHGTDVILGGKAGLLNDFGGLVLSNNLMIGKKVSRGTIITVTVRGVAPIILPDAIANSLSYVKAFGGTEQRNLPDGYIERQFIYMMDGSYLLTDIVPTFAGHYELEMQTTSVTTSAVTYLGSRDEGSGNGGLRFAHISDKTFRVLSFGNASTSSGTATSNTKYKFIWDNGSFWIYSGTTLIHSGTFTEGTIPTTTPLAINGWNSGGTIGGNIEGIYLYSFKAWNAQGELVADYVPAVQKGTVPVVGFYDTVSGTFKTATAGTFAAGGEAVPTPDAPMDIISNNGVLKARHQSGLPLGYTLLDYIESTGTQYIDTGVYISTGYKVRVKAYATSIPTTVAFFGCTSDANASDAKKGIYRLIGSTINRCAWGNGSGTVVGNLIGNDSINTWYDMVCDNGVWTINDELFATCPKVSFTSEYSMWLFARNTGGTVGLPASCRISVCQIWDNNGQMIRNLVPCKNASDVVGMYDLVNGVFYQNAGTGTFTAGTAVSDPVEIYADGTVETINVHGKNLFDKNHLPERIYAYFVASGTTWTYAGSGYSLRFPCLPNTTYTARYNGNSTQVVLSFASTSNDNVPTSGQTSVTVTQAIRQNTPTINTPITLTTGANDKWLIVTYNAADPQNTDMANNLQIELGSTATTYAQYYDGGTATAEMLLKVGDYQDEQEILSGEVTRNVGVKVLDGTEDWESSVTSKFYLDNGYMRNYNSMPLFCTHYKAVLASSTSGVGYGQIGLFAVGTQGTSPARLVVGDDNYTSVGDFKVFLADQYAAGTPVIVVYPLATPTTESVAGQTLQVQAGDNTLEITQASLNGLELEATYKSLVRLIIQEVEDANLNNNVEVTIS